ncbi:hypothetical protein DPMN_016578 [Dreissena polymorpha]|uniref:Uncharacterized protein n=1 Tax=Dreissena polymorpha TaxID=45954 RepID=A0A9D4NBI1_DREPO|nr:hypothetical protein DPMN_016578 [Dreissena polymorpha]
MRCSVITKRRPIKTNLTVSLYYADGKEWQHKILFLKVVEHSSTCNTTRLDAAVDALGVDVLAKTAVDLEQLQTGCEVPDMHERGICELTAPLAGDTYATKQGHELVAEALPTVETGIREFPDTVDAVGTIGLGQNILELALEMRINVVWIPVN